MRHKGGRFTAPKNAVMGRTTPNTAPEYNEPADKSGFVLPALTLIFQAATPDADWDILLELADVAAAAIEAADPRFKIVQSFTHYSTGNAAPMAADVENAKIYDSEIVTEFDGTVCALCQAPGHEMSKHFLEIPPDFDEAKAFEMLESMGIPAETVREAVEKLGLASDT